MSADDTAAQARSIEKYRAAVIACASAAAMVAIHDLPALLRSIEKADAIGPILDPTLYRDKAQAMREDAELLRAALPLWKLIGARLAAFEKSEATVG